MNDNQRPFLTRTDILVGLAYYFATTAIVVLGVSLGREFVKPPAYRNLPDDDFLDCFARFDGLHYKRICEVGYSYDPDRRSEVAFFPAYPLTARLVVYLSGCSSILALLIVAHVSLAAAFVLLHAYARHRYGGASPQLLHNVLVAFGVLPTTFFFRMAYSEALFLVLTLLAMLAIERHWPIWVVACIIGLLTATRPVGVAFIPVLALYLWRSSNTWRGFFLQSFALLPIASWGLIGFIAYQYVAFDEPLAFIKTQEHWRIHPPSTSTSEKIFALAILEPVWGVFIPSSDRYWARLDPQPNPLFSLMLANPVFFLLAALLLILGAMRRWLSKYEAVLGFGLLLIPYMAKGFDNSMASNGRFAALVFPTYLVLAQMSSRLPVAINVPPQTVAGVWLAAYPALFATGYLLY